MCVYVCVCVCVCVVCMCGLFCVCGCACVCVQWERHTHIHIESFTPLLYTIYTDIMLRSVRLTDQVMEDHAIMSQQKCLVNSGDYIELGTCTAVRCKIYA